MSDNPNDNLSSPQTTSAAVVAAVVAGATRRRLLRGGLAAGPVLMTVASRPVMAQVCQTSSASTSMAGSRPNAMHSCVSGRTPKSWLRDESGSSGYLMEAGGGTKDKRLFGSLFPNGAEFATKTLVEVMKEGEAAGASARARVAAHLVAAVLNAERGLTPLEVVPIGKPQAIWFDYPLFRPTAGVQPWTDGQIITWLLTTMPVNS